jgi:hypothetical protein
MGIMKAYFLLGHEHGRFHTETLGKILSFKAVMSYRNTAGLIIFIFDYKTSIQREYESSKYSLNIYVVIGFLYLSARDSAKSIGTGFSFR